MKIPLAFPAVAFGFRAYERMLKAVGRVAPRAPSWTSLMARPKRRFPRAIGENLFLLQSLIRLTRSETASVPPSKSCPTRLPHNVPPRVACHINDPKGVAELSPGLADSERPTLGKKPLNLSISRAARRAQRVSRDKSINPRVALILIQNSISRDDIAPTMSNHKGAP